MQLLRDGSLVDASGLALLLQPGVIIDQLIAPALLEIDGALHGHAADEPTLLLEYALDVHDALHGHAADEPTLFLEYFLDIDDALHGHSAGEVELAALLLREVRITHRTIPVPPARVGQTEWAEQHLILDGSLAIAATDGLEARLPLRGAGSPEGFVVANRGRMYLRTDGGVGSTLYVKEANDGAATGWAAK